MDCDDGKLDAILNGNAKTENSNTPTNEEIAKEIEIRKYASYYSIDELSDYEIADFKIDPLLEKLYLIQSPSGHEENMRNFIISNLIKIPGINFNVDEHGNLLVTKGSISEKEFYPCVVAHIDTVFGYTGEDELKIDKRVSKVGERLIGGYKGDKYTDRHGLGADDKNGIFVALKMLNEKKTIKAAFFVGEERGCIGSSKVDLKFFKNCGYLLEGDRRNGGDLIVKYSGSRTCSEEFSKKIYKVANLFGYKEHEGLYTDVMILAARGIGISVINFSVGYYNPHMDDEYTDLDELYNSKKFLSNIIDVLGKNKYEFKYVVARSSYSYFYTSKYKDKHHYGGSGISAGHYDSFYDDDLDGSFFADELYDTKQDFCSCSRLDKEYELINMDCDHCNPVTSDFTNKFCSCGTELVERVYTVYCPVCNKHKLINIYANF